MEENSHILFLGDIVGQPGRWIVKKHLAKLRKQYSSIITIANGENAAGGFGLTQAVATELFECGIDAITLGNHIWDQRSFISEIETLSRTCKPANLPKESPGKPYTIIEKGGEKIGVFGLLGRCFMNMVLDCPFKAADRTIETLQAEGIKTILVDIHAEATSEKYAIGWYLSSRVTAVMGTHTHVPTADNRILNNATAYLTDAGMCGPSEGILGCDREPIIRKFIDGMPRRFSVPQNGPVELNGACITFDPSSGKALKIERIHIDDTQL